MTPRCSLSPLEANDGAELHAALSSSRASLARWLPLVSLLHNLQACERYAAEAPKWWQMGGALRFSIRSLGDGAFWGLVGLDGLAHDALSAKVGVLLVDGVRGQGIASEAVNAVVRFAFATLGAHRLGAAICQGNRESIALFSRLGFKREGTAREAEFLGGRWVDHELFSLLSGEQGQGEWRTLN